MGVAAAPPAAAAAAGSAGAPEAGAPGATGVHPEDVAPGGAPSFIRKVLGPPAGAEASVVGAAAGVAVAAAASGGAGVPAPPEAGVAVAEAAATETAAALDAAPLASAGATAGGSAGGVAGAAGAAVASAGGAGSSVTSSSSAGVAAGVDASRADALDAAPNAPIVADGPTGASSWPRAGLIAPSAISPAAKAGNTAGNVAARRVSGERAGAGLVEAPSALMLDHASLVAELF